MPHSDRPHLRHMLDAVERTGKPNQSQVGLRRLLALSGILLSSIFACDRGPTEPDTNLPPTIVIENMVQEGYTPANMRVFFHAKDPNTGEEHQLARAEYLINGVKEASFPLSGSDVQSSFLIRRLHPQSYSLELVVYDRAGSSARDNRSFVVTTAPRRVTAEVYVNKLSGIERITQGQLCLGNDCEPINSEGVARFDSLTTAGPVAIRIPEEMHQQFLVSLATRRLERNIIDYTNLDYAIGRLPLDTLIQGGENERKIIFFENEDKWRQLINDYSWITSSGGYGNGPLRFTYPGDTLRLLISTVGGPVSDELAAKIYQRAREAITHANTVYSQIPWNDKHEYEMTTGRTTTMPDSAKQGEIVIDPNAGLFRWLWVNYDDRNQCHIESMGAGMNINHAFGERGIEHFTKYLTLTMLGGMRTFAPAGSHRFTQYPTDDTSLLQPVVQDDLLGMRLHSMYSGCTKFLTTKGVLVSVQAPYSFVSSRR